MVTRRHFQPLAGGFASILLPLTVWVALVLLTGLLAGCGALRKQLLDDGDKIPLDYQVENFGIARSPSDLVASPLTLLEPHFTQARSCYGNRSSAGLLLTSTLASEARLRNDVATLSPLPTNIPVFPSETTLRVERENFLAARKKPTERATAHETLENSALFVRVVGTLRPAPPALSARWENTLKNERVTFVKSELRSFYARSLEPGNEYQILVQCAALEATLPSGGAARTVWPVYSALEEGTLGASATQTFSLRSDIRPALGEGGTVGFTFLTPEVEGRVAVRSQSDSANTLRLKFHSYKRAEPSGKDQRLSGVAFREALSFHFTRFIARSSSLVPGEEGVREAFLSFQHGLAKSAFEAWTPQSPQSAKAVSSYAPRVRYLNESCGPTNADAFPEFKPGGLHGISASVARKSTASLAGFTEALPATQVAAVCASLLSSSQR